MRELKKAFLGGYQKKAVDTELAELRKKLAEAEADRQRYRREAEASESRVAELEHTTAELEHIAAEQEHTVEALAHTVTDWQRRAAALEEKLALLDGLDAHFDEVMGSSTATIDEHEALDQEIQKLYAALGKRIRDAASSTSQMRQQAKDFRSIYDALKGGVASAREDASVLLAERDEPAAKPVAAVKATVQPAPQTIPTVVQTTPTVVQTTPTVAEPAASDAAAKPPIRVLTSSAGNEKATGDFTQFGRKSRISAEERSELLRKALLRNSGN